MANRVFREYATSGVFQLSLSRNMVGTLVGVYTGSRAAINHTYGVSALRSLIGRGLVVSLQDMIGEEGLKDLSYKEGFTYSGEWLIAQPFYRLNWLTKAGELTVSLLQEAGLVDPKLTRAPMVKDPHKPKSKAWRNEHMFKTFADFISERNQWSVGNEEPANTEK